MFIREMEDGIANGRWGNVRSWNWDRSQNTSSNDYVLGLLGVYMQAQSPPRICDVG